MDLLICLHMDRIMDGPIMDLIMGIRMDLLKGLLMDLLMGILMDLRKDLMDFIMDLLDPMDLLMDDTMVSIMGLLMDILVVDRLGDTSNIMGLMVTTLLMDLRLGEEMSLTTWLAQMLPRIMLMVLLMKRFVVLLMGTGLILTCTDLLICTVTRGMVLALRKPVLSGRLVLLKTRTILPLISLRMQMKLSKLLCRMLTCTDMRRRVPSGRSISRSIISRNITIKE